MIVSNFRYTIKEEKCKYFINLVKNICKDSVDNCRLLSTVTFNYLAETRDIDLKEEYDTTDGIYLLHSEVWDETDNEKPNTIYSVLFFK